MILTDEMLLPYVPLLCGLSFVVFVVWAFSALFGGYRMGQKLEAGQREERRQAIEEAWCRLNPSHVEQIRLWLISQGVDPLEAEHPSAGTYFDGRGKAFTGDSFLTKDNSRHIVIPWGQKEGPWTTLKEGDYLRRLRAWEAYKKQNADDLDALQAYVDGLK